MQKKPRAVESFSGGKNAGVLAGCSRRPGQRAFTLIELLVVIGIIAILMGLLIGSGMWASRAMKQSRVRTELNQLLSWIADYKSALGFYPPDNPANVAQNQLFYELAGTYRTNNNQFRTQDRQFVINRATIMAVFSANVEGFANSAASASAVKSFAHGLKPKQYSTNGGGSTVEFLVVPVEGPVGAFNPWRYNSSSPTNNPKSFDLWAEIVIGDKTNTIGNWKN